MLLRRLRYREEPINVQRKIIFYCLKSDTEDLNFGRILNPLSCIEIIKNLN